MPQSRRPAGSTIGIVATLIAGLFWSARVSAADPLPAWNEGASKRSITNFVKRVTDPTSTGFVPPRERIAVFDNDGTLWCEQPLYVQLAFALDRMQIMAPQHPEWREQEPYKAALARDVEAILSKGDYLMKVMMASHAEMTTVEFDRAVKEWMATARNPQTGRPYTDMVYQPMIELLAYLRAHEFQTWIVSGGGVDFIRPWAKQVYGIPPERVVGSTVKLRFELREKRPTLVRTSEFDFINNAAGKPIAIQKHIGRRPLAVFGNSDGDLQMLQWTAAGSGPRLAMIVHHTDGVREPAYDRKSNIGRLDKALDAALRNGWTVVDIKREWRTLHPLVP
ncbi:MAG: HAD family hydrolase [Pirellulaceae bacterium]|jgi:phosphoglycolate phosphatase-like HAD superfamily hydrolase|nr:HAD family hydrolase [Pirellulaceae bacterium]MDP7014626.1 HAD family hydrolase [Pirellulaceae bacterium]